MRLPVLLLLSACSDYAINGSKDPVGDSAVADTAQGDSDDTGVPADTDVVDTDSTDTAGPVDSDSAEPTDTATPSSCEFTVWNGHWNDDGSQTMVVTKTKPVYTLLSPSSVTVSPGDDIVVDVGISSTDECGEIELGFLYYFGWSGDATWDWMGEAAADLAPSSLEILDPMTTFADSASFINTEWDPNIRYCWDDEVNWTGCRAVIDTQIVPATGEIVYRFTWKQSDYAPPGTHIQLDLEMTSWTDPVTGEVVNDYGTAASTIVDVTIE